MKSRKRTLLNRCLILLLSVTMVVCSTPVQVLADGLNVEDSVSDSFDTEHNHDEHDGEDAELNGSENEADTEESEKTEDSDITEDEADIEEDEKTEDSDIPEEKEESEESNGEQEEVPSEEEVIDEAEKLYEQLCDDMDDFLSEYFLNVTLTESEIESELEHMEETQMQEIYEIVGKLYHEAEALDAEDYEAYIAAYPIFHYFEEKLQELENDESDSAVLYQQLMEQLEEVIALYLSELDLEDEVTAEDVAAVVALMDNETKQSASEAVEALYLETEGLTADDFAKFSEKAVVLEYLAEALGKSKETVGTIYSEEYLQVQKAADEILTAYLGTTEMSREEIESVVDEMDEDTFQQAYKDILDWEENAAALSEEEIEVFISHNEVLVEFYSVLDETMQQITGGIALPIANDENTVVDGQVLISADSNGTFQKDENDTVTITVTETGGSVWSKTKETVITVLNETDKKFKLTFDFEATGYSECSLGASGTQSYILEGNASERITLSVKAPKKTTSTATLVLSNFVVELVKETANVTFIYDDTLGNISVNDSKVDNGSSLELETSTAASLIAEAKEGITFLGWVDKADGKLLSNTVSGTFTPSTDTTVEAVFVDDTDKNSKAYFMLGTSTKQSVSTGLISKLYYSTVESTHLFDDLNKAIQASEDLSSKVIVLANNGVLESGSYTIPKELSFLIPFDDANSLYEEEAVSVSSYTTPSAYRTLIMESGAELVIEGKMSLSAKHHYADGANYKTGGAPSGNVSLIKMEEGSSITVNSGGTLYAYGYITGTGSITAEAGSKIYENFQISDFRGGNQSTTMENGVFPVSQYYVQNIEVPLTLKTGAKESSYTTVYMSKMTWGSAVDFIAESNSMFNLTSGKVTKYYDGDEDRLVIEVNGDLTISPLDLKIGTSSINSEKYELPINSNITVEIISGTITIGQDMAMLPGAEIIIHEGASCVLGSGKNVYVYDADEWGGFASPGNYKLIPVAYAPGKQHTRTVEDLVDASIQVDGTMEASAGYVYTTKGGANIYSTDSGIAKIQQGTETVTYQLVQGTGNTEIPITPAKLKNGDGSYVETTTGTYKYKNEKWVTDCEGNHTAGTELYWNENSHWNICTSCGDKVNEAAHVGGTASCTEQAICSECHQKYGDLAEHDYDEATWKTDEKGHWHECKTENCTARKDYAEHTAGSEIKSDENNHWTECECGTIVNKAAHDYNESEWKTNGTHHWHECTMEGCTATTEPETHTPGSEIKFDGNSHWTECKCGKHMNEAAHDYNESEWETNGTHHWHECMAEGCTATTEPETHIPGDAIETGEEKHWNVCAKCGIPVNEADHDYDESEWKTDGVGHWHECKAEGCTAKIHYAEHTPGDQIKTGETTHWKECTECGTRVSETAHVYDEDTWKSNETYHWHECKTEGCTAKKDSALHTVGEKFFAGEDTHWKECTECGTHVNEAAHDYDLTKWETDGTYHWHKCKNCDAKTDYAEHTAGSEIKSDGSTHWKECTECGTHVNEEVHIYDEDTWKSNGTYHWHECKTEGCTAKKDSAEHTAGREIKFDENNHWNECAKCGTHVNEAAHDYDLTKWETDGTHHWHKCKKCDAKTDYAVHIAGSEIKSDGSYHWNECECGTIVNKAAHDYDLTKWETDGTHHWHKCKDCSEIIDYAEHTAGSETKSDKENHWNECKCGTIVNKVAHDYDLTKWETDGTYHWHKCKGCSEIIGYAGHTAGSDLKSDGEKHWNECTECQYHMNEEVHEYDKTSWKSDMTGHWYECKDCKAKTSVTKHAPGDEIYSDSEKHWNECTECQYHVNVEEHEYDRTTWKNDETNHWHECKKCSAKTDSEQHKPGAEATETEPQLCTECSRVLKEATGHIVHTPSAEISYNETEHWYKCVGCEERLNVESHKGGEATCSEKATCTECGQKYGLLETHDYDTSSWKSDKTGHWYECTECKARKSETTHTAGTQIYSDGEKHWNECTECQYHMNVKPHDYDMSSWESDETGHWYECTECKARKSETTHIAGTQIYSDGEKHWNECTECQYHMNEKAHEYDTGGWKSDATSHWYECSCGAKTSVTKHTAGTQVYSDGENHWNECTECQYHMNVKAHEYDMNNWKSDETGHWYECSSCGARTSESVHISDDKVHKNGEQHWTECTECQYHMNVKAHEYDMNNWKSDETGHWHECSACGAKTSENAHTAGTAIYKDNSEHWNECTECQYHMNEEAHEYDMSNWKTDESSHWYECVACGAKTSEKAHTSDNEVHKDGEKHWNECTECKYHMNEEVHEYDMSNWKTDESSHWYECVACGARTLEKAHTSDNEVHKDGEKHWSECTECQYHMSEKAHEYDMSSWKTDESSHWYECSACGARTLETAHTSDNEVHKDGENHWNECTECKYHMNEEVHEYDMSNWKTDESSHWYECVACGAKTSEKAHTSDNEVHKDGENHWNECTECKYHMNEEAHEYDRSSWKTDESSHWYECGACGARTSEKAHTSDNEVHKDGDNHWTECTECQYHMNEKAHEYDRSSWKTDESSHWYECGACGARTSEKAHTSDNEVHKDGDNHWSECTECRYHMNEKAHEYDMSNWKTDESSHWYECVACGAKTSEKAHTSDNEVHKDGENHWNECTECQYHMNEEAHEYDVNDWKFDDTEHWYECGACGERLHTAAHKGGTATCTEKAVCSICSQEYGEALNHDYVPHEAKVPTYASVGWNAYNTCSRCDYSSYEEIPVLEKPVIKDYATFIETLPLLEELAMAYVEQNPGKDPLGLIIKYIRTGVDRYNSGSWNIMAGYEDTEFAKFVLEMEEMLNSTVSSQEELICISCLKDIENFELPNGDEVDFGHMFGTMDITYTNKSSVNHADVAGWAGDLVDLLSATDRHEVTGTLDEMIADIAENYLCHSFEGEGDVFSQQDMYGDLDGYYIMKELYKQDYEAGTLSNIAKAYFTADLTDENRAAYFVTNRLGGVTSRTALRDAVYKEYIGNKMVKTLEGTRTFVGEDLTDLRRACSYAFADYLCELAGDWVELDGNNYYTVFETETSTLAPGITQEIKKATTADDKQIVYYIATADITDEYVNVYANYNDNDPSTWKMAPVIDQANAAQKKYGTPSSEYYIPNYNVIASINADGYDMSNGRPNGLLVMGGVEYKPVTGSGFFAIMKDGTAMIGSQADYYAKKDQVQEAVGAFGTTLIKDGKMQIIASDSYYTNRASRTAVGITKTGKVVFMVLDGRQEPFSCGGSMQEIAQIMMEAGCVDAINLDGGGSSTYVSKPEGADELEVTNSPSDGISRSVSSSLMMVSTAPSETEFDHALVEADMDYMTVNSTIQLRASGVSATGNTAELPAGATWAVSDENWAMITEDGALTALRLGNVDVSLMLGDEVLGSTTVHIVNPENLYFSKTNMDAVYGEKVRLPIVAVYANKKVAINENDVVFTLGKANAGTVEGFYFNGSEESGIKNVKVTAALAINKDITATMTIALYKQGETSFDFDQAIGGDRMLAWDRQVSNATTEDTITYYVIDPNKPMETSYIFAIDMTQIPIPEQLADLVYMLPGADVEGASAWNFLLQLAQRVSDLTEVKPVIRFDKNVDVDYSQLKIINDYFVLTDTEMNEETNELTLTLNWKRQTAAIDASTANPLCILNGIKLTPKADADWGSKERLNLVTEGTISYEIYLRAHALYTFAQDKENQEKYGLKPFVNPDAIIDGEAESGASFGELYAEFTDSYTLVNSLKNGWVYEAEEAGFAYYVSGERLTGIQLIQGYYYEFDENGINVGQTKYTGLFDIKESRAYARAGVLTSGWLSLDGELYCFDHDGIGYDGDAIVENVDFIFDKGLLVGGHTGFAVKSNGKTYYYENGRIHYSWLQVGEDWYHFNHETGVMTTGTKVTAHDTSTYYDFADNGVLLRGYFNKAGHYYWVGKPLGSAWVKAGGDQDLDALYRTLPGGHYMTDYTTAETYTCVIDGFTYTFNNKNGKLLDGIVNYKDLLYSYQDGKLYKDGWFTIGKFTYYAYDDGHLAVGTVTIDGKACTFTSLGVLIKKTTGGGGSSGGGGSHGGGGGGGGSTGGGGGASGTVVGSTSAGPGMTAGANQGIITDDAVKGKVNSITGIVTGTSEGYSNWVAVPQESQAQESPTIKWKFQYANGTFAAGTVKTREDNSVYHQPTWELINGNQFAFGIDGYLLSGWVYDPDKNAKYYVDVNRGMLIGWQLIDQKWYYFQTTPGADYGKLCTNTLINGFYVDANGVWDGKTQTIAEN